jgi:alanine racemase
MNYKLSRAWAEIHVDKIQQNIINIKNHIGNNTKLMAVVKADAYGHGFWEIAKIAVNSGCDYLAVACISEAKQIRRRGINTPILILGDTPLECVPDLFLYNVIPTVFEDNMPKAISQYAISNNLTLKIHIKVDTGMGRIGFNYFDCDKANETIKKILDISKLPGIEIEGIFTHFSSADEENGYSTTKEQFTRFMNIIEELEKNNLVIPIKHTANSAAICLYKEMHLSMVRAGLILYGEYPSEYVRQNTTLEVSPAMEIKARVSQVKDVKAGQGISYGKTFVAEGDKTLATVSVGYADSYFRGLSNKAKVIVNGKFAYQVGNICMDQMVIDVTGIENVCYGTEVILIGRDKDLEISFSDISNILGTINYEVICDVGKRVVKAYFLDGRLEKVVDYLEKI